MLSESPTTYTSPPPPAAACNPLHPALAGAEPLPLMPQFFSPSPLLQTAAAPQFSLNPATGCATVRYTAVPISPSAMYPFLAGGGAADPLKQQQQLYCNQAPIEVIIV